VTTFVTTITLQRKVNIDTQTNAREIESKNIEMCYLNNHLVHNLFDNHIFTKKN
jgi:hypothetical protein